MSKRTRPPESGASTGIRDPFARAAPHYWRGGWPLIPVGRNKVPRVAGYHGGGAPRVTAATLREWCEEYGTANVALVMPPDIVGIDVDAYDGKRGLETIADLETRLGAKLPPTYVSTARDDGSGIRFYRVPPGLNWPGNLGDDSGVDIIWQGDRYAVVAPSIHGKTGTQYRWIGLSGEDLGTRAPCPGEMTELPPEFVEELTSGRRYSLRGPGRDLDIGEAMAWLEEHGGDDEPCEGMARTAAHWLPRLRKAQSSTRHDTARAAVWAVVQDAGQGHRGAAKVLRESLYPAWRDVAGTDRDREFKAMIAKAVGLQDDPEDDPCELFAEEMHVSTEDGERAVPEKSGGNPSVATVLVQLAMSRYELGQTDLGEPFGVPRSGPPLVQMLRGGAVSLRAQLAQDYYRLTRKAASQTAVGSALLALEGAAHSKATTALALRAGRDDEALWLDLGDSTGNAVRVAPDGWSVEDSAPLLFRRTKLTAPLPEPVPGGSVEELWDWVRVAKRDRPLVLAWLVAALMPDIPHPVAFFTGEQGAGKSVSGRVLRSVLDPSHVPLRKPPRDAEAWVTTAAGGWVVGLDNLSSIPEWLSDVMCRAVTGDGDVRRTLYEDDGLTLFRFRRCILVNGIDLGALRGDLEDRMLPIALRPITPEERKEESALWPAWEKAHPALLGALLDLSVQVLAEMPHVVLDGRPRMADFARVLAAVDAVLGTRGVERYAAAQERQALESVLGNPVADAIRAKIGDREWEGIAADLYRDLLQPYPLPHGWPKTSRDLGAWLRRYAPVLRKSGWEVSDDGGRNHAKVARWRLRAGS